MTANTPSLPTRPLARNAFWVSLVLLVTSTLILGLSVSEDLGQGNSPASPNNALILVITLASLAGMGLSRIGRPEWAGMQLSVAVLIGVLGTDLITSGLGLTLGGAALLLVVVIAGTTLSGQRTQLVTTLGIAGGVASILLDLFWPVPRPASGLADVLPYVVAGMFLAFGVLLYRQFRHYSLRTKLITAFAAIAVIAIGTLSIVNDRLSRQALTNSANQALLSGAQQTASALDTFVASNLNAIRIDTQLSTIISFLTLPPEARADSQLRVQLFELLRTLSSRDAINISSYAVLDANGVDLADTFGGDVGQDKSNRDYFRVPVQTRLAYMSPVEISPSTGRPSIYFSAPIRTFLGTTVGVLRVRYDAAVLQDLVAASTGVAGPESFATLLDEHHIRLGDGGDPGLLFTSVVPLDAGLLAQLQNTGRLPALPAEQLSTNLPEFEQGLNSAEQTPFFTADVNVPEAGEHHLDAAAAVKLESVDWLVVYSQPQEVFLAPVFAQQRTNLLLALLISALVVAAAILFAQVLAGPIARLTAVADRVRGGDLKAQARVEGQDEIGTLAVTFNAMTAQLRETLEGLEQRVAERTKALVTSAQVSRRLSTIIDRPQLVKEVVEQLQRAFNYYHVHIYLFDEPREHLLLVGGTGEAGQVMLERGHSLPRGRGLVGRAADTNTVVLVPDVAQALGWLPNPLLPDTRAELAVPIALGDQVLGVLDVQHNVMGGLRQEDAELIRSIADQVAVALQNTRLYQQAQRQAETESLVNVISQKIQNATTVQDAIQVAIRELGRALGAPRTSVRLRAGPGNGREQGG